MGIRKHFENKSPDQDLKLQDLALEEEQKSEFEFDAREFFNDQKIRRSLESTKTNFKKGHLNRFDAAAKILFPEEFDALSISPQDIQKIIEAINSSRERYETLDFALQASDFKMTFPKESSQLALDEDVLDYLRIRPLLLWMAMFKTLYPDKFSEEITIYKDEFVEEHLGKCDKSSVTYIESAKNCKIILPETTFSASDIE